MMSERKVAMAPQNLDEDVIRRVLEGDQSAIGEVIMHYQNYVKKLIIDISIEAGCKPNETCIDDICQMVWIKFVINKLKLFQRLD